MSINSKRRESVSQRSKFKMMSSQVHNELNDQSLALSAQDHKKYLDEISTSINCESDLKLYKIGKAISNEVMSVVTIRILDSLSQVYSDKNYLIRCYRKGKKFFEMAVAYILARDLTKVYAIKVGKTNDVDGEMIVEVDQSDTVNCMLKPQVIVHQFQVTKENLLRFTLSHFMNEGLKMTFVTTDCIFIYKFNLDKNDMKGMEDFYNSRPLDKTQFDVQFNQENEIETKSNRSFKTDDDFELDTEENAKEEQDQIDVSNVKIQKFLDFGSTQLKRDIYDAVRSMVLLLDSANRLILYKGDGEDFELHAPIRLKTLTSKKSIVSYQILDAVLIQSFKLMSLVEITTTKIAHESEPHHLHADCGSQKVDKQYKIYVYEIKVDNIVNKYKVEFKIDPALKNLALKEWKNTIVVDALNKDFYFKDYSSINNKYNRVPINNSVANKFEQFEMANEVVSDIVGQHNHYETDKYQQINGLLYKDFIVFDNLITIAHSNFITIVEIQAPNQRYIQHLALDDNPQVENQKGKYNFEDEVHSLCLMDKEEKDSTDRWKVLVIFQNLSILELKQKEDFLYHPYEMNQQRFLLENYLKDDNLSSAKLPGPIIKTYKQTTDTTLPPFFLVFDEEQQKNIFCTIEYNSMKLKKYDFKAFLGTNSHNMPTIALLNTSANNYQNIMIIDNNAHHEKEGIEQTRIKAKVSLKQFDSEQQNMQHYSPPESVPIELDNVKHTLYTYANNNFLYVIFNNCIAKMDLQKDQVEKLKIIDNFGDMKIFNDKFFYWKSYVKNEKIQPYICKIQFDQIENIMEFRLKTSKKSLTLFEGIYPHLQDIYHDKQGETLSAFVDYSTIKIWPLLHQSRIKLPKSGKRTEDVHILGTQRFGHILYSIHTDNSIKSWHLKTGKLVSQKTMQKRLDLSQYQYERRILIKMKVKEEQDEGRSTMFAPTSVEHQLSFIQEEFEEGGNNTNRNKKNKPQDEQKISDKLNIDLSNCQDIKITEYQIIRFKDQLDSVQNANQNADFSEEVNLLGKNNNNSEMGIEEIYNFKGPVCTNNNNYGLYISTDLKLVIFFFRDNLGKLILNYYELTEKPQKAQDANSPPSKHKSSPNERILLFKKQANLGTFFSPHSKDFKYLLEQNDVSGLLEIHNYDGKRQKKLDDINKRIQEINASSASEPSFLDDSTLIFMSPEKVIMNYDFLQCKENYFFTQCLYPGSGPTINLDSMIKTGNHLLGENTLILERFHDPKLKTYKFKETVSPNNFNYFFKQIPYSNENEVDDPHEMKYIQMLYKQKVDILQSSYFGSIFQSREYLHKNSYQTNIYLVNTFNYYEWRILAEKNINIEDMNLEMLKKLSFAQLPDGTTLLHKIAQNQDQIRFLFEMVNNEETTNHDPFYVPVLSDAEENNVFDLLLSQNYVGSQKAGGNGLQKSSVTFANAKGQNSSQGKANAITLLEAISNYPFELFKIKIAHLIDQLADQDINVFAKWLDERCKSVEFLTQVHTAFQSKSIIRQFTRNEIWALPDKQMSKEIDFPYLEDPNTTTIKVLDIPEIHFSQNAQNRDNLNKIFDVLYETRNIEPFESDSIKALIEVRWQKLLPRIICFELIPYVIYMTVFYIYTIYDCQSLSTVLTKGYEQESHALRVLLGILIVYFLCLEALQILRLKLTYFMSVWNWFDLFTIILVITGEIMQIDSRNKYKVDNDEQRYMEVDMTVRSIYSVTSLILWIRVLYFFRIFRNTGYFIRMIVQLSIDIMQFLFIFALTIVAFGHAYYVFLKNNEEGPSYTKIFDAFKQTFLVAFGQYDILDDFGNYNIWLSYAFFILCLISLQIVLLNLIISIVSETYSKVKDNYNVIMYKDLLSLVIENRFLFSRWCFCLNRHNPNKQRRYILLSVPDNISAQDQMYEEKINEILVSIRDYNRRNQLKQKKVMMSVKRENRYVRERLDKIEKMLTDLVDAKANQPKPY